MHAVIATSKVDASVLDPEHKVLREQLIPAVKAMPGVVTAYWLEPTEDLQGVAVVVFDAEESARKAVSALHVEVGSSIAPGITFTGVQVGEVIGHF